MKFIESKQELRAIYGDAWPDAMRKQLDRLDQHARHFLDLCPFVMIGSQGSNHRADVTPRGDRPGFIKVLDARRIALPDRPGNNRLDTWENVVANPSVGLCCIIPGFNETLRINGSARLTADSDLCASFQVNGIAARTVLIVDITEVYFHCAKAFVRSQLWASHSWPDRSTFPTLGEISHDQLDTPLSADEIDALLKVAEAKNLW